VDRPPFPNGEEGISRGKTDVWRIELNQLRLYVSGPRSNWSEEGSVNDSVAVDAKRILLRYGAPIAILDSVNEDDQIKYARLVARTPLQDREARLRELLAEGGYLEEE